MNLNLRQSTYAEDLAAAHVFQKIAHHQVRRGLNIGSRNTDNFGAVIDEGSSIGLNRKTNYVKVGVALRICLARSFKDQLLAHRTILWAEDKGNWFIIPILN